VNELRVIK